MRLKISISTKALTGSVMLAQVWLTSTLLELKVTCTWEGGIAELTVQVLVNGVFIVR